MNSFSTKEKKKKFNLRFSHPEGVRKWELRETGRTVTSRSHPGMQILPDPGLAPGSRVFGTHRRGRTSLLGVRKREKHRIVSIPGRLSRAWAHPHGELEVPGGALQVAEDFGVTERPRQLLRGSWLPACTPCAGNGGGEVANSSLR